MRTNPVGRSLAILATTAFLLVGAAACGSSDSDGAKASGGGSTTAPSGTDGGTDASGGDDPAGIDPCQWYTAEEMEAILGFPVTMEAQTIGESRKCVYDAPDNYSSVEITPGDDATFNGEKAFASSPDGVDLAGEVETYDGIGDSAWGHSGKGGADVHVLKGTTSVAVAITNGGGGPEAGNIATPETARSVAQDIARTALGL